MNQMLPPDLLQAISDPSGGKVTIITGAGCSFEAPTSLPLAWECSKKAHQKLIDDNLLSQGECENPEDLTKLADAIRLKHGSQAQLVKRLPVDDFRYAKPNNGHLIAVALMVEKAIAHVITLNFDLAFTNAITRLGVKGVNSLRGPEEHDKFGLQNIVYLHRNVDADHESWILTTDALDQQWKNGWEEIIAGLAVAIPYTVFAGMGSSCGVLTHTAKKICVAIKKGKHIAVVDPCDPAKSKFINETGLPSNCCLQMKWVEFMESLGQRFRKKVENEVKAVCEAISIEESWTNADGSHYPQLQTQLDKLTKFNLLQLGVLRARWTLDARDGYRQTDETQLRVMADILLAASDIERLTGFAAVLVECGCIRIRLGDHRDIELFLVSGASGARWSSIETLFTERVKYCQPPMLSKTIKKVLGVWVKRAQFVIRIMTKNRQPFDSSRSLLRTKQLRKSSSRIHLKNSCWLKKLVLSH